MCHDSIDAAVKYSQIYKKIIFIPKSVGLEIKDRCIFITGKLGRLMHVLHKYVDVQLNDLKYLDIYSNRANINNKALVGTTKALLNGMIIGVTLGFERRLQLVGIGYRAVMKENNVINLIIGFSHAVDYVLPAGIQAQCLNNTEIILTGINKQLIGQVAANLRAIKPPEPFKGKGIRYIDELIRNKDTKKR